MNWLQANTMNIHELIRHLNHGQRQGDGTSMIVGRHAVVEAIRLLNLLGETNEALAACQSEGSAWKRKAEECAELLRLQLRARIEATEKPWKAHMAADAADGEITRLTKLVADGRGLVDYAYSLIGGNWPAADEFLKRTAVTVTVSN